MNDKVTARLALAFALAAVIIAVAADTGSANAHRRMTQLELRVVEISAVLRFPTAEGAQGRQGSVGKIPLEILGRGR